MPSVSVTLPHVQKTRVTSPRTAAITVIAISVSVPLDPEDFVDGRKYACQPTPYPSIENRVTPLEIVTSNLVVQLLRSRKEGDGIRFIEFHHASGQFYNVSPSR